MLKNKFKNAFNILIIDDDVEFNDRLCSKFKNLGYKSFQSYALNSDLESMDELNLIILNIDLIDKNPKKVLKYIEKKSKAKIILLSSQDDTENRDEYFRHGILDYHLKSNYIDHVVNDIDESIDRLNLNKNETILVIDDSKVICFVIKKLLEGRNYNVLTALSAKDGLNIIEKENISLLILDMELPDMHGTRVLGVLRDLYYINDFPTLVISGSNSPSIVRIALKKGASDFLKKPFLYEEFLLKIDLWIKSSIWQKAIKKQKKQIENSLKSFEALVNSTMESLFIFEKNICIDINDLAVELLGFSSKKELLKKNIIDIFPNVTKKHKKALLDDKMDHYFEDILINQDGLSLQVQIKEKNVLLDDRVLKIIAVMDITKIKQKENMLYHQTKMASMGEMIGNIAHQWRQPLTAISVAAGGIMLSYELDIAEEEETLRELDNIVINTQFLSNTIENFQNFLKENRETITFNVKKTIEKTIAIVYANLDSHEINIITNYNDNIQMNAVENDIIQVLLNIINNAADILITKQNLEQKRYIIIDTSSDGENIIIQIQDTAGGVPSDIIDKIFEPYFTTKHQSQGTGLGLYMTHQIVVDNMKGSIKVENCSFEYENIEYFGARFIIKIPLS